MDGAGGQLEFLGRSDSKSRYAVSGWSWGRWRRCWLAHESVVQAVVVVRVDGGGERLVGYVVPVVGGGGVGGASCRRWVAARLPSYMVPAAVVVLEALPLTAVGKVDRAGLPVPDFGALVGSGRGPVGAVEAVLAGVFAQVLGVASVGAEDSFFGLGGDSIMSIQVVSRARAAGVSISARDVFECKTVAGLAQVAVVARAAAVVVAELPGGGVGEVAVTPIVAWLLEHGGQWSRFSQSVLLSVPVGIEIAGLARTVQAVLDRHDMLRARLSRGSEGWRLDALPVGSVSAAALIRRVVVTDSATQEFSAVLHTELAAARARLDPAAGVMVQVVWFDPADAGEAGRLLVVVHHLVVDGVSWRVLVPDLAAGWARVAAGGEAGLAPVGTSMRRWARGLVEAARTPERVAELELWRDMAIGPDPVLGVRPVDPAVDGPASVHSVRVEVSAAVTEAVLTTRPAAVPRRCRRRVVDRVGGGGGVVAAGPGRGGEGCAGRGGGARA